MSQTKIALVTGGSRGLGKDMALSLAAKGIDVILTYRNNEEDAKAAVAAIEQLGRKAVCLRLDMADFESLDGFVGRTLEALQSNWDTNHFDFLINNAGMGATVPFLEVKEAMFTEFLNVHFKSIYFLSTVDLNGMLSQAMASSQALGKAMAGATKVMAASNKQMNLQQMQQTMSEFERQNATMDMKEEMSMMNKKLLFRKRICFPSTFLLIVY